LTERESPEPDEDKGGRPWHAEDVAEVEIDPRGPAEFGVLVYARRAVRLGTALGGLTRELAASRREVAALKRENAALRHRGSDGESDLSQVAPQRGAGPSADFSQADGRGGRRRTSDGTAGDAARQRLGQDLHDGVQQRLTAVRIRITLAADSFQTRDDQAASVMLDQIGDELDRAIDEVRAFADGIYPALLTSGGLSAALASVNNRTPESVTIAADVDRHSPEIETAVYFTCLAALDNAAKHAGSASVTVRLWDHDDALHFTISDTGPGFDQLLTPPGAGITNMRDRIAGVGGTLRIDATSPGTIIEGSVPHTA
jgi:signal transduction histidine kinase